MAQKLARFSWLPGGLAATLVVVLGRLLSSTSSAPLEFAVYDRVLRASADAPTRDIVIIAVDDESIARFGPWPWARDVHAELINRLHGSEARLIAFATPFTSTSDAEEAARARATLAQLERSDVGRSAGGTALRHALEGSLQGRDPDATLANAIREHGNVVLSVNLRPGNADTTVQIAQRFLVTAGGFAAGQPQPMSVSEAPPDVLANAANGLGHVYLPADDDARLRTDLTVARTRDGLMPSLAAAIAADVAQTGVRDIKRGADETIQIGPHAAWSDPQMRTRPQYFPVSGPRGFAHHSYWQVLAGTVPDGELRGKIVLVGFMNAASTADSALATPASNTSPTVVSLASAASSLMQGTTYSRTTLIIALEWGAAILVILFAAFALPAIGVVVGGIATVLLIAVLAITEIGLLSSMHGWARLMLPSAAVVAGFGLYVVGELIRRANVGGAAARDPSAHLRSLGQTFQKQGQLDLAFETYRRCPLDAPTMELLYLLGTDFEKRRQLQKAGEVYGYMATRDPGYRDLRARRARVKDVSDAPDSILAPRPAPASAAPAPASAPVRLTQASKYEAEPDYDLPMPVAARKTNTRTLGRYEIERELGKGAMGTVYLGRDPTINRVVAIKAIPLAQEFEEDDLEEARARFFREAEMAGRLNHPAIVTVYDAGEDQGLAYIAMEYLRGQHLSHHTDPSRLLPVKTVMLLVARVADALHYAHRQNVVHRDIKPANIMFNADADELKITDFGIARLTDTSRTKTGIVLGTPSFMSPEQLEGRTLDGRSDQFALGISLYQLLCGQLPFRAESMPRLMQKIATEPHAPVRLVRPELPECIDPIIDRTMAKVADDRYPNCAAFAADLRGCAGTNEDTQPVVPKHEWLIP